MHPSYFQPFMTHAATEAWLDQMGIENYTINDDLSVNVEGSVDLNNKKIEFLPIKFKRVKGDFYAINCGLTHLKGLPDFIYGNCGLSDNKITTFADGPSLIEKSLNINNNSLSSLKNMPIVGEHLVLSHNQLESLQYLPELIHGNLFISHNPLKSLEYCPREILGHFICAGAFSMRDNLHHLPKYIALTITFNHNDEFPLSINTTKNSKTPDLINLKFEDFQTYLTKEALRDKLNQNLTHSYTKSSDIKSKKLKI